MFSNVVGETAISVYGEGYLISVEERKGLQWNKLSKSLLKSTLLMISFDTFKIKVISFLVIQFSAFIIIPIG